MFDEGVEGDAGSAWETYNKFFWPYIGFLKIFRIFCQVAGLSFFTNQFTNSHY